MKLNTCNIKDNITLLIDNNKDIESICKEIIIYNKLLDKKTIINLLNYYFIHNLKYGISIKIE